MSGKIIECNQEMSYHLILLALYIKYYEYLISSSLLSLYQPFRFFNISFHSF